MKKTTFILSLICALLSGCAQHNATPAAPTLDSTTPESMVRRLEEIDQQRIIRPNDISLRAKQAELTISLVNNYLRQAEIAVRQNNYQLAEQMWRSLLLYQPGNLRAQQGLRKIDAWRALDKLYRKAVKQSTKSPERALSKVQKILEEDPNWPQANALRDHLLREIAVINQPERRLSRELEKPVSLNFRQHNLQSIFNTISQLTGVNIIFDKDISPSATASIIAKNTTAQDAINLLLTSNNLRKKVLNANTFLVYPATVQKEKIYRDIVVKTIFLGYAKAKEVNVALRNLVKLKDVHVDERTNSVTVRGSKESVEKAERLMVTLDRPEAEVTLAVEVLEVNTDDAEKLGLNFPQQISASFSRNSSSDEKTTPAGGGIPIGALNAGNLNLKVDGLSLDMKKVLSNAKVLANPRIRVKNNKKAMVDIGQKIPVLTSIAGTDGFSQQKVEYQDVGMKLEVTPDISMDDNISMDVKFTLSSLGTAQTGKDGAIYYSTNSREANTTLSSMNGETQMLAGLIKEDDNNMDSGVPFLSKIPLLGRLFGSKEENKKRTEVVLLITPTIERSIDLPGSHISTIEMGSEDQTGEGINLRGVPQENLMPIFNPPALAPPAQFLNQTALPTPVVTEEPVQDGV